MNGIAPALEDVYMAQIGLSLWQVWDRVFCQLKLGANFSDMCGTEDRDVLPKVTHSYTHCSFYFRFLPSSPLNVLDQTLE